MPTTIYYEDDVCVSTDMITHAVGHHKAIMARDVMKKLLYNGSKDPKIDAALSRCMTMLNKAIDNR